jgi:hypothetical protein
MHTTSPRKPSRPARHSDEINLAVTVGRNKFGFSATVNDHPGTWAAHTTSPATAVIHAAWKVAFKPEFIRRPVWEMWMATKVEEFPHGLWLVSLPGTHLATLRPYLL